MNRSFRQSQASSTWAQFVETSLKWQEYFSQFQNSLMGSLVTSIFLYACDSWILTAEFQRKIQAMEMRATARYYTSHTKTMLPTRKSVPRSSRQFDHTKTWPSWRDANCSGMDMYPVHQLRPKPSCKVAGRQGRQRKRWNGNTREWTNLEFGKSQRAVENREKWRKLIVISSVAPQRTLRLRDRWWCWWLKVLTYRILRWRDRWWCWWLKVLTYRILQR